jgi:hypothetical protein
MAYGGGDLNIGLRLNHIGIRGVRAPRWSACTSTMSAATTALKKKSQP